MTKGFPPDAVDQRSDWPATEAVNVTLNFPNENPLRCGLSSKSFDLLLMMGMITCADEWLMWMRLQKTGAYSSLLSIGSADPRLNGNYTCTASNAAATAQHTANLHVDGKYSTAHYPLVLKQNFISDTLYRYLVWHRILMCELWRRVYRCVAFQLSTQCIAQSETHRPTLEMSLLHGYFKGSTFEVTVIWSEIILQLFQFFSYFYSVCGSVRHKVAIRQLFCAYANVSYPQGGAGWRCRMLGGRLIGWVNAWCCSVQFLRGGRSSLRTRRSCWVTVSSSTVSLTETRRLSSRGTKTTVRPSHCQQHRTTGVNHVEEGRGERRVPKNLQYGRTLMQIIPPVFQKYRSEITKTRHFKRKIHFFSGEGPISLPRLLPNGLYPRPEPSILDRLWICPFVPRIPTIRLCIEPCNVVISLESNRRWVICIQVSSFQNNCRNSTFPWLLECSPIFVL